MILFASRDVIEMHRRCGFDTAPLSSLRDTSSLLCGVFLFLLKED